MRWKQWPIERYREVIARVVADSPDSQIVLFGSALEEEMIREMAQHSQFVLVTHNRRTMEGADTLYGITMEQAGVSKVVSVRLNEAA